jgi:hypothetical protein
MYVKASKPSLEEILDALADYQSEHLAFFVNERVRLTRPAVVQRTGGPVNLVGVGIADEVTNTPGETPRSFSELAADAALLARKAAEEGPGTFQSHLSRELVAAGRAPGDPSREHYVLSVGGQSVVVRDRHVTGATIMSAANIDSTRHDLMRGLDRLTAEDRIFVRPGVEFRFIEKEAPKLPLRPPKLDVT